MRDILLVTVESLRYDARENCDVFDDLQTLEAVTMGHYTRPSLAGLLAGQYGAALSAAVEAPTLADVLGRAGYETIGVCMSPQTTPTLGFDTGFAQFAGDDAAGGALARGTALRERLGELAPVRALHRRLRPKHATLSAIQPDAETVDEALGRFHRATPPRFLWVHLMDSHRPYGRGAGALPKALGRKAAAAPPSRLARTLSAEEAEQVRQHYRCALTRASGHVRRLIETVPNDTAVIVCGDHGEELGEAGYWFHAPYRRRTVDTLTRVPLGARNVDLGGANLAGLADVAPTLADVAGVSAPDAWDGAPIAETNQWLTVAPWAGRASVAHTTPTRTLRFGDASIGEIDARTPGIETKKQLAALGYR